MSVPSRLVASRRVSGGVTDIAMIPRPGSWGDAHSFIRTVLVLTWYSSGCRSGFVAGHPGTPD